MAAVLVFGFKSQQKENSANSLRKLRLSTFAVHSQMVEWYKQ
jgi:hypothetical protein